MIYGISGTVPPIQIPRLSPDGHVQRATREGARACTPVSARVWIPGVMHLPLSWWATLTSARPAVAVGLLVALALLLAQGAALIEPEAASAAAQWRLEQPPPPAGSVFNAPLGKVDDLEFYAPNEGLMSVEGNGLLPAGLFFWNGRVWHELSTVCGGSGGVSRIAWAGPDEFWVITSPSEPRVGAGVALCHFKDGEVVGSYSTPYESSDPFQHMDAAACDGPNDCWFAGVGSQDPSGQRVGAFHLHWNGQTLTTSYQPQGRGVSALAFFRSPAEALRGEPGTFYESTFVGQAAGDRSDPVALATPESRGPVLIHRLEGETFTDVNFASVFAGLEQEGVPEAGDELLSAHSEGTEIWFSGGGAASGPTAPTEGSQPESVPSPPLVLRNKPESSEFELVDLENQLSTEPSPFSSEDRFVDVAPVPGRAAAWVADQALRETGSTTGKARVALIGAGSERPAPRLYTLPASGAGRGAAQLVASTGPEEAWMVTSAGWVFHYTNGAVLPEDTDPYWAGTITVRPNEAVAQFVPDIPPPDDAELFAPPPVAVEPVAKAVSQAPEREVIPALLEHITVVRRGLTVIVNFKLTRLADVQLVAKRHGTVIARTARRRLKPGRHDLQLAFSRASWPTALGFKTKELTKPKPVPVPGGSGESKTTGPNVVSTSAHWLTGVHGAIATG